MILLNACLQLMLFVCTKTKLVHDIATVISDQNDVYSCTVATWFDINSWLVSVVNTAMA